MLGYHCHNCGSVLRTGDMFCGRCGVRFDQPVQSPPAPDERMIVASDLLSDQVVEKMAYYEQRKRQKDYDDFGRAVAKFGWFGLILGIIVFSFLIPMFLAVGR